MKGYIEDIAPLMSTLWAQDIGPGYYRFQDPPQAPAKAAKAPEPQPDPEDLI